MAVAAARRLSELLQEQQEPFLPDAAGAASGARRRPRPGGCCPAAAAAACRRLLRLCNPGLKKRRAGAGAGLRAALGKALRGCGAVRRALRWDADLAAAAGCFSAGACGGREFRRLRRSRLGDSGECDPRAMVFAEDEDPRLRVAWKAADMDVDSSRQLSPVSVLDLHSDDDDDHSPAHSHRGEDEKASTSGSSPSSDAFLGPATSPCFAYSLHDKLCEMEVDEGGGDDEAAARAGGGRSIEEQISSWERIAGDIARIPAMMELDLSRSARRWREARPEVREIGARIETLIFDDIRSETVCDMLASQCTLAPATSC